MAELREGAVFYSVDDFQKALVQYQENTGFKLSKLDSHLIPETDDLSKILRYNDIKFACPRSGQPKPSKGKGKKDVKSLKVGCTGHLKLRAFKNENFLKVVTMNVSHKSHPPTYVKSTMEVNAEPLNDSSQENVEGEIKSDSSQGKVPNPSQSLPDDSSSEEQRELFEEQNDDLQSIPASDSFQTENGDMVLLNESKRSSDDQDSITKSHERTPLQITPKKATPRRGSPKGAEFPRASKIALSQTRGCQKRAGNSHSKENMKHTIENSLTESKSESDVEVGSKASAGNNTMNIRSRRKRPLHEEEGRDLRQEIPKPSKKGRTKVVKNVIGLSKNENVPFAKLPENTKLSFILKWMTLKPVIISQVLRNEYRLKRVDVQSSLDKLPDAFKDSNVKPGLLKKHMEDDALILFQQAVKAKKRCKLSCQICQEDKTSDFTKCSLCLLSTHISCLEFSEKPKYPWFCVKCSE